MMRAPAITQAPTTAPTRPLTRLSAALLLALCAGCANLAPPFERPAPPLRTGWTGAADPSDAAAAAGMVAAGGAAALPAAPDLAWQDFITDDRLRQTIAASLANNPDLRLAALAITQSRALYRIADAATLPQIDASAVATRQRSQSGTGSTLRAELGLASYEIDAFNRVGNLGDAALARVRASEEDRHSVQISLVAEVATRWLTLAADLDRLALARDTLDSQRASYDLTRRAQALGGASGLALAQAQTTVESARVEVARLRSLSAQDRNALERLVGRPLEPGWLPAAVPPAPAASAAASAAAPTAPAAAAPAAPVAALRPEPAPVSLLLAVPAGLPSELLQRRPDVRAAEQLLRAANADIGAARAAFYPRIGLTASAGSQSASLAGLFGAGSGVWSLVPRIDLPLFDGGQRQASLDFSQAQQAIEIARYQRTLQTAFSEVADTLALRDTLAEQLAAQAALTEATRRSLLLSDALFRNGASSQLDLLDAQRSLYAAQQALIGLRLSEQTSRIALYRTLGGGWGSP